jgi:hypothetical protein
MITDFLSLEPSAKWAVVLVLAQSIYLWVLAYKYRKLKLLLFAKGDHTSTTTGNNGQYNSQ